MRNSLYDTKIMEDTWLERGFLWFKTFAGAGGGEPFFNATCARCFRSFMSARGHRCLPSEFNGIVRVDKKSPLRMKTLCERMAHVANSESLWDGGIFGRRAWTRSETSEILGGMFFLFFENGFPCAYVIYNTLEGGKHIVHHLFTAPYRRRRGHMTRLLNHTLPLIGENQFTIYHREPIMEDALQLWEKKFGVDRTKYEFYLHWTRFKDQNER